MSIAGDFHKAVLAAERYECEAVQLFTAAPQQSVVKRLPEGQEAFRNGELLA
jgi:hypothetical protein